MRSKAAARGLGGRGSSWQTRWPHFCAWINWEEQLGRVTDCATQGSSSGNKASEPLAVGLAGVAQWIEYGSVNQRVTVRFPVRPHAHAWVAGQVPRSPARGAQEATTH